MTTNSRVPSPPPGLGLTIGRRQFLTGTGALTIPPILRMLFVQRHIIAGLTRGAVKE